MVHEVIGPDVIAVLCSQTYAGTIVEPQSVPLGVFIGNLQPFTTPKTLFVFFAFWNMSLGGTILAKCTTSPLLSYE
jgi:hypothetical protein